MKTKTIRLCKNGNIFIHKVGSGKISLYNYNKKNYLHGTWSLDSAIGKVLFNRFTDLMIDRKIGPGRWIDYITRKGKGCNHFSVDPSGTIRRTDKERGDYTLNSDTAFGRKIFNLVLRSHNV